MKTRAPHALVLVLAAAALAAPLSAQQEAADRAAAAADTGVSFDFQNAELRAVLTALAEAAGVNIVYSDLPDRSVTLRTPDPVPPEEVRGLLESVARANGLELESAAGVLRVYEPEESAAPADTAAAPGRPERGAPGRQKLFVHRLDHADAETVVQTLRTLFGLGGGGLGGGGGDVGRTSLSEDLRRQSRAGYRSLQPPAEEAAGAAGAGRGGQQARARTGRGGDGEEAGMSVLLRAPAEIVPDPRSNAVLVLATPPDYETIKGAIEKLDVRPLQVLIEVLIAEVRQTDDFALGNSIEVPIEGEDGVGFTLEGGTAGDVALQVLGIGGVGASTVLSALATTSDVRILSRPVVMAQNNKEARILVGDQRPFVQLQRSLPTDASVRDQVVQYRNVGTELRIRPTINRDGYVNLSVLQEVSNATAQVQFGAPVINTRESETDVLVKDGHTAVLGGLVDHQTDLTESGIPLLKDIPLLGGLFGTTSESRVATELFILLTPHVLSSDRDMRRAREEFEAGAEHVRDRLPEHRSLLERGRGRLDSLPSPDTVPRPGVPPDSTASPDTAGRDAPADSATAPDGDARGPRDGPRTGTRPLPGGPARP